MIRRAIHLLTDDEGFTLAELMVSLVLLVVVLAVAFQVSSVVRAGQRLSDREAQIATAITYPMSRMSEILMQNTRLDVMPAPTGYVLSVRTDQDVNDVQEQHNFRLVTAGGDTYIEHSSYLLDASGVRVLPARFVYRLGTGITNATAAVPLFKYYNAAGVELTDMSTVPGSARKALVTIRATVDGRSVTESVMVSFRNRSN